MLWRLPTRADSRKVSPPVIGSRTTIGSYRVAAQHLSDVLLVRNDQATAGRRGQERSARACQRRFSQRGSATQVAYRSSTGDHSGVKPYGAQKTNRQVQTRVAGAGRKQAVHRAARRRVQKRAIHAAVHRTDWIVMRFSRRHREDHYSGFHRLQSHVQHMQQGRPREFAVRHGTQVVPKPDSLVAACAPIRGSSQVNVRVRAVSSLAATDCVMATSLEFECCLACRYAGPLIQQDALAASGYASDIASR
jgi:hypothetical protein